jgi:hypothetical protein
MLFAVADGPRAALIVPWMLSVLALALLASTLMAPLPVSCLVSCKLTRI